MIKKIKNKIDNWFEEEINLYFENKVLTTNNYTLLVIYLILCLIISVLFNF